MPNESLPAQLDRHTRFKDRPNDPDGFRYRWNAKGEKVWCGYIPGRGYVPLGIGPKREARALWDELRGKASRGEKLPRRDVRFGPLAEAWYESKQGRLRLWTLKEDRRALDKEILPRFGHRKLAEISADDIVKFTRYRGDIEGNWRRARWRRR
jgi:hypothetical protein